MRVAQDLLRRGFPMVRGKVAHRAACTPTIYRSIAPLPSNIVSRGAAVYPRLFSSDSQSTLIDILAREEQEEQDSGNLEMPADLAELKASLENNWKIVEDGATTNLFMKDKKVQVSFHCQDTVEAEEGYEEGDEDEDEAMDPVRFCVTVSKAGKTLAINCVSEFGEAKIEGVFTTPSTPDAIHANQGDLPEKSTYQGPDYLELAEDLQEAFLGYLEDECGVDADVASFVAMYTDYREQTQYAQFLKDAQSIIS
jgi:complement component 1 Q subcomponent-binding protein